MKRNTTTSEAGEGPPIEAGGGRAAARFLVRGRVQGVGFRWWTCRARALGLSGSVRNLPDGRVEVIGSGRPADLATLRADLGQGPPGASVEHVQEEDVVPPTGSEFRIEP
jgi:acylphosphatase